MGKVFAKDFEPKQGLDSDFVSEERERRLNPPSGPFVLSKEGKERLKEIVERPTSKSEKKIAKIVFFAFVATTIISTIATDIVMHTLLGAGGGAGLLTLTAQIATVWAIGATTVFGLRKHEKRIFKEYCIAAEKLMHSRVLGEQIKSALDISKTITLIHAEALNGIYLSSVSNQGDNRDCAIAIGPKDNRGIECLKKAAAIVDGHVTAENAKEKWDAEDRVRRALRRTVRRRISLGVIGL